MSFRSRQDRGTIPSPHCAVVLGVNPDGLALVPDVGYPTPGSFGSWGGEQGIGVVTYEFPLTDNDTLVRDHVPVLAELLAGDASWF